MPRNPRRAPNLIEAAPMPTVQPFPAGGYRFISHQFQYSGGVAAEPGFRIERARFARSLPLADGFDAIEAYLARIGCSPTAFCACELRSPAQFTDAGFCRRKIEMSLGVQSRDDTRVPDGHEERDLGCIFSGE